ncbi:MAG TPA: MATE family efflux transporter [Stellaceae bacterium]|nr:MATE family efflux transporter [Stellaceae bacterium]
MIADRSTIAAEIRATCAVAAPLAAANLAQMAMQVTNTIMVGHLGAASLAAAGLGAALYATLLMTCQGVLAAVAPLAAHAVGADDHPTAGRVAGAGLIVAALLAAPIIAVLSLVPLLLAGLGYDPALVAQIARFLWVICWGAPAFLGFAVLRFLLVAVFRARIVMLVSLLAVPLNAALNWMMIFGHLGMPALGIRGSAGATAIVSWLMLLCFAFYLRLGPTRVPVRIGRHALREIPRILRLGVPIGALRALEIGLFVTVGVSMGVLGKDALAAHQLVFNLVGVCFMVPLGLGQAATVRVAVHLGAGDPRAACRAAFVALALGASFMVGSATLLLTAPRAIVGLYLDLADPANRGLVMVALQLLFIAALFQVFDGVQVIAVGALRGYRDAAVPMVIAAVGYWAIGFAGGWLLAFPLGIGAVGLWSGLAMGLAVVATSLAVRLYAQARSHIRTAAVIPLRASELPA